MSAIVLTFAVVTVEPAYAQRRDGGLLLPEKSGPIIVAGCLVRGDQVRGGDAEKYVLARPTAGPVDSVPEATCTAAVGADAITLDHATKYGIGDSMLGRWVEISGRLEKETSGDPDNLRELDVESFRLVPVVTPRAEAAPAPRRQAPPVVQQPFAPAPAPAPVAITPEIPQSLPKTAGYLPVIGLLGLFSLAGGAILRSVRSRE
jgi:hypothetical protein